MTTYIKEKLNNQNVEQTVVDHNKQNIHFMVLKKCSKLRKDRILFQGVLTLLVLDMLRDASLQVYCTLLFKELLFQNQINMALYHTKLFLSKNVKYLITMLYRNHQSNFEIERTCLN